MPPRPPSAASAASSVPGAPPLEERIAAVGKALGEALAAVVDALPGPPRGPADLAAALGLDKVLAHRLLKATRRGGEPMAVVWHVPGPEPLRRFLRAAGRSGVPAELVRPAREAVAAFEDLVRRDVGDRSSMDAMLATWLPEARAEFELRRKQAAFKAMSQLKGASVETTLATVLLHPSDDGARIDVVWVMGLLGVRRLRPGATVHLSSRRIAPHDRPRRPLTLDGREATDLDGLRLDAFCGAPPAPLDVHPVGEVVHYTLGGEAYGPRAEVDLLLAEVNRAEMARAVPRGSGRKGYVFAEIGTPTRRLLFDVLVHDAVYPGAEPTLRVYDTCLEGVADVNDPARDVDRLDLAEAIVPLGRGAGSLRASELPRYTDLVRHVLERMGWDGERFRAWRCRVDYPLHGSQVAAAFDPPEA